MEQPLRITFHGIEHSDAIEQRIRAKAAELERFADRITSCHVTIDAQHKHHHKGNLYSVRLHLHLPGSEIIVDRGPTEQQEHEDIYVAIRDAFDSAVRQLEERMRIRRGDVKHHA